MHRSHLVEKATNAFCDTAGFYDVFFISDVILWLPEYDSQQLRDICRSLTKQGILVRDAKGVYRWS